MNIVCFASEPWYGLWQRHQHLMSRLSERGHKIVYIDPTNLLPAITQSGHLIRRMEAISDNLVVARPLFLPFHYLNSSVESIDGAITYGLVEKALKRLGAPRPDAVWSYSPYFNFMMGKWPDSVIVYDCVDACDGAFCNHYSNEKIRRWMLDRERELLRVADAVMAVSKGLLERCSQFNNNTHLVPNGTSTLTATVEVPEDLMAIKRPTIGYIGRLGDWVDYDLLSELAVARPDLSIVLVGPLDTKDDRIRTLSSKSNVHFLGRKEFSQVPGYIRGFDVCIIPFTIQPLTRMANPVKLFEYASLGKPIVSTPLDGVLEFSNLVYASDGSSEGFINNIDIALKEDDAGLRGRRIEVARKHDWEYITDMVEVILESTARTGATHRSAE